MRYDNHPEEWRKILSDPEERKKGEAWLNLNSLDAWRHDRMRAPIRAIVEYNPELSWLTIGDGRYGTDANYLLRAGAKNVHCTDISDSLLRVGSELGFINSFSAENAENLQISDDSFDWVYCKEALHHFPRPYTALHEMLRVARRGIILTEPRDPVIDRGSLQSIKNFLKRIMRVSTYSFHEFEEVGNYVYTVSERELEKFLLGIHYTGCAFIGCNDSYIPGIETICMTTENPEEIKIINKLKESIRRKDLLCSLALQRSSLLTSTLFKAKPSSELVHKLKSLSWTVKSLPANPHL